MGATSAKRPAPVPDESGLAVAVSHLDIRFGDKDNEFTAFRCNGGYPTRGLCHHARAIGCGKSTFLRLCRGSRPYKRRLGLRSRARAAASAGGTRFRLRFPGPPCFWRSVIDNVLRCSRSRKTRQVLLCRSCKLIEMVGPQGTRERPCRTSFPAGCGSVWRLPAPCNLVREFFDGRTVRCTDEITRDKLNEELLRLWQETGTTILFVTHSIPEAAFSASTLMLQAHPGRVKGIP